MLEFIQNSSNTASTENDYSDFEVDTFWLEEETENRHLEERCLKVVGVLQQSVTRGCNFPEEFKFQFEPWTAMDDLLLNISAAIPAVIVTLIVSILVGIAYWIISYAIYRLIKTCMKKSMRFQFIKKSSSTQSGQIVLTSLHFVSELISLSPKKMLAKLKNVQKRKYNESLI